MSCRGTGFGQVGFAYEAVDGAHCFAKPRPGASADALTIWNGAIFSVLKQKKGYIRVHCLILFICTMGD